MYYPLSTSKIFIVRYEFSYFHFYTINILWELLKIYDSFSSSLFKITDFVFFLKRCQDSVFNVSRLHNFDEPKRRLFFQSR